MMGNNLIKQIVNDQFDSFSSSAIAYIGTFFLVRQQFDRHQKMQYDLWHLCNLDELTSVDRCGWDHWFWINVEYMLDHEKECPRCGDKVPKQFLIQRSLMNRLGG